MLPLLGVAYDDFRLLSRLPGKKHAHCPFSDADFQIRTLLTLHPRRESADILCLQATGFRELWQAKCSIYLHICVFGGQI